jgi:hypothetical protein
VTQTIHYRGFEIEVDDAGGCAFAQSRADSPRVAATVQQARMEIDLALIGKAWFAPMGKGIQA